MSFRLLVRTAARMSVITALFACAHVSKTRPTPKGVVDLEIGAGGPIVALPGIATIPLPLTSAGASYGVLDNLDVSAHLQLTSLALFGVLGVDVGTSWMPLTQLGFRPAATLTGRLYGFTDFKSGFRPYLELEGNLNWRYAKGWLGTYGTINGAFQLFALPVLMVGVGQELFLGRVGLTLEARWYQPSANSYFTAVNYAAVGQWGAIGVLLGVRVRFGDKQ